MEDTHMTHPERIEKLLFVITIAFIWSYKTGDVKTKQNSIPIKSHGRRSKSIFRLGLDCLQSVLISIEQKIAEFLHIVGVLQDFRSRC